MADFNQWSKENLVKFAEAAVESIEAKDEVIRLLKADLRLVQTAWRDALQSKVADATLPT